MNNISIFYTINENYAPYLSVSIMSLIDYANSTNNYNIHIIHEDLTKETIDKLKELEKGNVKLEFINMIDTIKPYKDELNKMITKTHFPITVYYRIFLPNMFKEHDKGIYIDADTTLNADIAELYEMDLDNHLFAGCVDKSVFDMPFVDYYEQYVGISRYEYINSGVLLMNMKRLREVDFAKKFLSILKKYDFEVVAPDQDYINRLAKGNILHIDEVWNAMPVLNKKELSNPKLIHYNLMLKPWHYKNIPYENYFWKYAKKSPFIKDIENTLNSFDDEKKKNDQATIENMIEQARRLNDSDKTMKYIFENKERRNINDSWW